MSFIYAEKVVLDNNERAFPSLHIMGDTKYTPIPNAPDIMSWGKKTYPLVSRYGLVKSMIIGPKCCISFAGNNIAYAHDLLTFVYTKSSFSEEELIEKATEIHLSAPKDSIEFLICTVDETEEEHIVCIKNKTLQRNCPQAWIGSYDAYKALQAQRDFSISKKKQYFSTSSFKNAIEKSEDDSVGGFITSIRYDYYAGHFTYSEGMETHVERAQIIHPGGAVSLYENASDGGYLVHYHENPSEFVLSIDQGDLSIVYTNGVKYDEPNSINEHTRFFMIPILMRTSTWKPLEEIILTATGQ